MKIIISERQSNYLINNLQPNLLKNQLDKLKNELFYQYKIHELRLNMFEYNSEKEKYLNSIKRSYIPYFKKNNTIISEYYSNFKSNLIVESFLTVNEKLKKYFNFITCSFLYESHLLTKPKYFNLLETLNNDLILEQGFWSNLGNKIRSGYNQVGDKIKQGAKFIGDKVGQAWNYVKNKGVSFIMDGIRAALDSGVGTAVQTFLAFTGVGNVATAVVWGVMALYDLYMYLTKKVTSPLNLIMSILGAISTGVLAPLLKPFKSLTGSISSIFTQLFAKLPVLKNWVGKIAAGAGWLVGKIKAGAEFAAKYLGIKFLSSYVSKASKWIGDIVKSMTRAGLKKNVILKNTLRSGIISVGSKMGPKMSEYLLTTAGQQMANTLSRATLATINKELITGKLKTYGQTEVLNYIDKTYGKTYGNFVRVATSGDAEGAVKNLAKGNIEQTKNKV